MSHDDEQCLKVGREIVRMIRDVGAVAGTETGYARRKFTYPGGAVHIFIANDARLADIFDEAAAAVHRIANATAPSERN